MKKIKITIGKGEDVLDFEGFVGQECSDEENKIRQCLGRMGVQNHVKYSDNKREAETDGGFERIIQ